MSLGAAMNCGQCVQSEFSSLRPWTPPSELISGCPDHLNQFGHPAALSCLFNENMPDSGLVHLVLDSPPLL